MTGQIHISIVQATGVGIDSVGAPVPLLHHNACSMYDLGSHVSPADSVGLNRVLQRLFLFFFSFSFSFPLILSKKKFRVVGGFETRDSLLMSRLFWHIRCTLSNQGQGRYYAMYLPFCFVINVLNRAVLTSLHHSTLPPRTGMFSINRACATVPS